MVSGCKECEQAIVKANMDLATTGRCQFVTQTGTGHCHQAEEE